MTLESYISLIWQWIFAGETSLAVKSRINDRIAQLMVCLIVLNIFNWHCAQHTAQYQCKWRRLSKACQETARLRVSMFVRHLISYSYLDISLRIILVLLGKSRRNLLYDSLVWCAIGNTEIDLSQIVWRFIMVQWLSEYGSKIPQYESVNLFAMGLDSGKLRITASFNILVRRRHSFLCKIYVPPYLIIFGYNMLHCGHNNLSATVLLL